MLVSWSSGKDSAWMLHQLRLSGEYEIIGLVTSFRADNQQVTMHGIPGELVEQQAAMANLELWRCDLPWPCSNAEYESAMQTLFQHARAAGVTHIAFGDLYLEDVQKYRLQLFKDSGLTPIFPIWGDKNETHRLAHKMIDSGLRAIVTCVDTQQLSVSFVGKEFDHAFLKSLPAAVDPCGENGEFHTFCYDGPMFSQPVLFQPGEIMQGERFVNQSLQLFKNLAAY
jgi:uncharacterized protein (TIGR00290 family)